MEISLNTKQVDASVALKALQLYKGRQFNEAINALLEILDIEPKNEQARLYLGVCYYKTNQNFAAQRVFRFLYENAVDAEMKKRAREGLQAVTAAIEAANNKPLEFGRYCDSPTARTTFAWME